MYSEKRMIQTIEDRFGVGNVYYIEQRHIFGFARCRAENFDPYRPMTILSLGMDDREFNTEPDLDQSRDQELYWKFLVTPENGCARRGSLSLYGVNTLIIPHIMMVESYGH